MSGFRFLKVHRPWEDWFSMLLGVLIGLSPWFANEQGAPVIAWNAVLVGLLVLAFAQLEYISLRRWEEACEIALGLWLIASPFIFGYADDGVLRHWHFLFGALVVVLAIVELWQDWRLSDKELARHGQ